LEKLTEKQDKFVKNILSGMTQAEAYRNAGYKVDAITPQRIAEEACKLAGSPKISQILRKRREALAKAEIWSREEALRSLRDIAVMAKENALKETGGKTVFDASAANAATKAIEQANKMCGYNEAEKVDASGKLQIVLGEAEKYAR